MEGKLYRLIMMPAMVATLVFGSILLWMSWDALISEPWMHAKLSLVAVLLVYHFKCGCFVRDFAAGRNEKDHRYFRWFNEVPTLLLLLILVLVVLQPW